MASYLWWFTFLPHHQFANLKYAQQCCSNLLNHCVDTLDFNVPIKYYLQCLEKYRKSKRINYNFSPNQVFIILIHLVTRNHESFHKFCSWFPVHLAVPSHFSDRQLSSELFGLHLVLQFHPTHGSGLPSPGLPVNPHNVDQQFLSVLRLPTSSCLTWLTSSSAAWTKAEGTCVWAWLLFQESSWLPLWSHH